MSDEPKHDSGAAGSGDAKRSLFFTVFPSIMLPMFLAVVDQTIVATALPAIVGSMGHVERASWIVVAYLIAATIAAPIYGRLGDAFGRRRLLFVALTLAISASLLCALARTMEMLILARVLQGFGGGGLMTLSQALVGETIPPRERARYQGYIATVAVCANSFGPVVGGYLTEHFGWQSIFLVNVPVGLIALGLVFRLPKPPAERLEWRADPGGVVLFSIFVATTLFSLEQVQRMRLVDLPLGGMLFLAGMLALALLVVHENRTQSPLIPLGLLRQPAIWHSDAMAACHGAAMVSLIVFIPVYLEVVRGFSPSMTGLVLVPFTLGIGVGSLTTGRLVSSTGRTSIFPVAGLTVATACFISLAAWIPVLGIGALGALMLAIGTFMGTVMGVVQVMVQSAAGRLRLGEAAATVQFSRSIGAAFGTALVATCLFAFLALRNPDAARLFAAMVEHTPQAAPVLTPAQHALARTDIEHAFRAGFLLMGLFCASGVVLALTHPLKRI